jgi:ketosteroid isomerase-like protein
MRTPLSLRLLGLNTAALLAWGCMKEPAADRSSTDAGSVTSAVEARDAIRRQSTRLSAMYPSENVDSIMSIFAEDAIVYFPEAPEARGKAAVRERYTSAFGAVAIESLETQIDTIEVFGDVAYEWGTYRERYAEAGKPQVQEEGRYLMRWGRQPDGSWRVTRFTGHTAKKEPVAGGQSR